MKFEERYLEKQHSINNIGINPEFPNIIKIDICNTCNYQCIFCPQSKQSGKIGCIDDELCIKLIRDGYNAGARELALSSTGEPLLNMNLEKYIKLAKDIGYNYVFINTNGYLMDRSRCETLLTAGIDSIKVSLNSSRKKYKLIHGVDGYDVVMNNIKSLAGTRKHMESQCRLFVSYVATSATADEADEVKKAISEYVDDFVIMNANNRGGAISEMEGALSAGKDIFSYNYPCSQIFNNAYVTAEGYLTACCQDFENVMVVADLHTESIKEAWNNETFTAFRKRYLKRDLDGTLCMNCLGTKSGALVRPLSDLVSRYSVDEKKEEKLIGRIIQLENMYVKKEEDNR